MGGQRNRERATHVRDLRHVTQRHSVASVSDNAARGKAEELAGALLAVELDDADRRTAVQTALSAYRATWVAPLPVAAATAPVTSAAAAAASSACSATATF